MKISYYSTFAIFAIGCLSSFPATADTNKIPLQESYEFQVRLAPDSLIPREEALAKLLTYLKGVELPEGHTLKIIGDEFDQKKFRKVEYFDTGSADLAQNKFKIRRRNKIGKNSVELTFKANGKIASNDKATLLQYLFSGEIIEDVEYKQKLEKDVYFNTQLSKWAYSMTLKSKTEFPKTGDLGTLEEMKKFFPQININASDQSEPLVVKEREVHWRAELEVDFDGVYEFDLTFPYSTYSEAKDGNVSAIEPEISWRAPSEDHEPSLILQRLIAEEWGEQAK